MVQKTNKGTWAAICTKIGKASKIATNYNQGGGLGVFIRRCQAQDTILN